MQGRPVHRRPSFVASRSAEGYCQSMSDAWWLNKESYERLLLDAESRLSTDSRLGGDRKVWAEKLQPNFRSHRPAEKVIGQSCMECGETWPCRAFAFITAPD